MILVLLVGPNLISQDLRFNALPLYFSRPLRRIDYFLGKLGVIGAFLGMVMIVPAVIAYILGLLFSLDITILRDTLPILLGAMAYGLVIVHFGGHARAGAVVAVAEFAVCRPDVAGDLARELARLVDSRSTIDPRRSESTSSVCAAVEPNSSYMNPIRELAGRCARADEDTRPSRCGTAGPIGGRWFLTPPISRGSASSCSAPMRLGRRLSNLQPAEMRVRFLLQLMAPQYPWYWSAGVLAVLFGLSAWILNFRIRSLDRLK